MARRYDRSRAKLHVLPSCFLFISDLFYYLFGVFKFFHLMEEGCCETPLFFVILKYLQKDRFILYYFK